MRLARRVSQETVEANPWVAGRPSGEQEPPEGPAAPVTPPARARPQHHVIVGDEAPALPRRTLTVEELLTSTTWVVGVHGGAGTSTLARFVGAADGERAWPLPPSEERHTHVLLCARAHLDGLQGVQAALREWASGQVPGVELDGVVLVAAAPKLPSALKPLVRRVEAAAGGAVWQIGWHPRWLVGAPTVENDRGLEDLLNQLSIEWRIE